jgi:hypothetical protein
MKRIDIMKYVQAIKVISVLCGNETPIKVTEFMKEHKLTNYFFDAMKHLGIIKPVISEHREGIIFSFKRMADNETFASIAMRVCDLMGDWSKNPSLKPSNRRIKEPVPMFVIAGDIHARPSNHQQLSKEEVDALINQTDKLVEEPVKKPVLIPLANPKKKSKAAVMITFEYSGDMNKLMEQITELLDGKTGAKFVIEAQAD